MAAAAGGAAEPHDEAKAAAADAADQEAGQHEEEDEESQGAGKSGLAAFPVEAPEVEEAAAARCMQRGAALVRFDTVADA